MRRLSSKESDGRIPYTTTFSIYTGKRDTAKGATTDESGNYSITVDSNVVLVFTYVGMETQEVAVKGRTELMWFYLPQAAVEQIVVVGYGTQRKRELTGSMLA